MHSKAWLCHCSQRYHLRTAARQVWVCLSDIPCLKCLRSWSAAGSPNLCTNLKLRLHQLDSICSSHSFVFIDIELATPGGRNWRKSTRQWPVSGPVLEGRVASCSAWRQITHTNHTSMNYKYCLFYICEGMTSPLQSKVSPQRSCATGLGVPFQYTLFKVSAQLVCSWLP